MTSVSHNRFKRNATAERGQALLEILPVIMLLLTLTFAVIDFGRAIWEVQVITGLTREGSNLASRNTTLTDSANAVIKDGSVLNLQNNGAVIITSIENKSGKLQITGQVPKGNLSATSRIGNGVGSVAVLPATTPTIPQPGGTVYVTEVFCSYTAITPLGAFVSYAVPSTLYDIAYF
jgi:Flp pilus assembly protein TadG